MAVRTDSSGQEIVGFLGSGIIEENIQHHQLGPVRGQFVQQPDIKGSVPLLFVFLFEFVAGLLVALYDNDVRKGPLWREQKGQIVAETFEPTPPRIAQAEKSCDGRERGA